MSEQDKIELFAAWLADELSADQQSKFEEVCTTDADFAKRVGAANFSRMLGETSVNADAPSWDKEEAFDFSALAVKQAAKNGASYSGYWWQRQGLSMASFACSVVAIVMVTTGFNVQINEGRVSVGFNQSEVSEQDIAALVDTRIATYQQTNQMLFSQYIDAMQSQQIQANTQLTEYLLSSSRQERREDFAELIKFVNEQRSDDQNFYARQINDLKQDIDLFGSNLLDDASSIRAPMLPTPNTAINE
jgi:hypothetical protein